MSNTHVSKPEPNLQERGKWSVGVNFTDGTAASMDLESEVLEDAKNEGEMALALAAMTGQFGDKEIRDAGILPTERLRQLNATIH